MTTGEYGNLLFSPGPVAANDFFRRPNRNPLTRPEPQNIFTSTTETHPKTFPIRTTRRLSGTRSRTRNRLSKILTQSRDTSLTGERYHLEFARRVRNGVATAEDLLCGRCFSNFVTFDPHGRRRRYPTQKSDQFVGSILLFAPARDERRRKRCSYIVSD
jgi:hypothetical protein